MHFVSRLYSIKILFRWTKNTNYKAILHELQMVDSMHTYLMIIEQYQIVFLIFLYIYYNYLFLLFLFMRLYFVNKVISKYT